MIGCLAAAALLAFSGCGDEKVEPLHGGGATFTITKAPGGYMERDIGCDDTRNRFVNCTVWIRGKDTLICRHIRRSDIDRLDYVDRCPR